MARGTKKEEASASGVQNPEATARKRLKRLAFSNNILSENQAKSSVNLTPSKTVLKHHGKDILKKSQRKNRFLFSFPGLIAPISGGKIGELKDLGTKNPVLYLDFPQGQMKLFGTIIYPKNRYLTLQFSRGGKNVMCEDYFDNMIVFSDAWWIGKKDENPEEARLEIPKELHEGQQADCDFKGGAGASSVVNQNVIKRRIQHVEHDSPKTPTEDDLSGSENNKDTKEVVSVRHSERTAGKTYNFRYAESSGDDSDKSSPVLSEHEGKLVEVDTAEEDCNRVEKKNPYSIVVDIGNDDAVEGSQPPIKEDIACASGSKSKKLSQHASATVNKEISSNKRGSLVQATLSTLFKKVEEKKAPRNQKKSPSSKVSGQKSQRKGSKRKIDLVDDDDDIEGISSAPENTDGSDEDWAA